MEFSYAISDISHGQNPFPAFALIASPSLLSDDPLRDLGHDLLLYPVETMVCHRFTGISLGLPSFKREQLFAWNGGEFVHDLREISIFAELASIMFVMDNEGWNLDFTQGHFRNRTGPLVGEDG